MSTSSISSCLHIAAGSRAGSRLLLNHSRRVSCRGGCRLQLLLLRLRLRLLLLLRQLELRLLLRL